MCWFDAAGQGYFKGDLGDARAKEPAARQLDGAFLVFYGSLFTLLWP